MPPEPSLGVNLLLFLFFSFTGMVTKTLQLPLALFDVTEPIFLAAVLSLLGFAGYDYKVLGYGVARVKKCALVITGFF